MQYCWWWWGFILLCSGFVLANQEILSSPQRNVLLDSDFDDWISDLGEEWGMKGLAIAAVRLNPSGEWNIETKGYGIKDSDGNPATEDVSRHLQVHPEPPIFIDNVTVDDIFDLLKLQALCCSVFGFIS